MHLAPTSATSYMNSKKNRNGFQKKFRPCGFRLQYFLRPASSIRRTNLFKNLVLRLKFRSVRITSKSSLSLKLFVES